MELTGKKALIMGVNSGIGLATARLFIAEGAQVAITGRDQKTLDERVAEVGPNVRGYRADLTVAEDRERAFAALAKDFGNSTWYWPHTPPQKAALRRWREPCRGPGAAQHSCERRCTGRN